MQADPEQQRPPGPTKQSRPSAEAPKSEPELKSAFTEIHQKTRHIAEQTDKIAEHLLDGQSTPRRQAARTLLAQLNQMTRNQALMIDMMEEILRRLPPMPEQGPGAAPARR